MKSLLASVRREDGFDRVDSAVRSLEEQWRHGEPVLERCWADHDPGGTMSVLAALVKADLRCRYARGGRPAVNDYLDRFPVLCDQGGRVLSLVYEEFCLREEHGERPDPESFCARYAPWRDSLASQLKYHQLLSQVVGPPTAPARFPEPGERFLGFAIDSVLGQGGAARVYRAREDELGGREVALKVSPDRGLEASIMGRLDHEHIVPVHNVVVQEETQLRGLIMPYRPGLPLDEVIRRVNPSSRPRAARVLWETVAASAPTDLLALDGHPGWSAFPMGGSYAQGVAWLISALAGAVAYAHAHGIQHRDIKPANILLTLQGGPQLLDFNLAHDPHAAEQAEAALRGGTLPYMAPEQLEAFVDPTRWESVGAGADLYSLGLVMYELLTGQAPELPDQSIPLPRAIRGLLDRRADQRFAPRRLNPAIPHALEAITLRCLAYSNAGRYASAQELVDDLHLFLRDQPLQHAVNPSVSERLGNWGRRNWLALAASALVCASASYYTVHQITPIERRYEFRAVMDDVDQGKDEEALSPLASLAENYPDSALVQLYYCVGQVQNEKTFDQAAALFDKITRAPHAEAVLHEWAREYPGVVRQLERLGIKFYDGVIRESKKAPVTFYPQARKALATAIHLGSKVEKVQVYAALLDADKKEYDEALRKVTAVIEHIQRYPDDRRVTGLNDNHCYYYRARIAVQKGKELRTSSSSEDHDAARSCFEKALLDLDEGERLVFSADAKSRDRLELGRANTEIALGDVAILQGRRNDARAHSQRATPIVGQHRQRPQRQRPRDVESLKKLEQALAKLDRDIEALSSAVSSLAK